MTPSQIRQRRKALNMTPAQFGQAVGLSENSARITVWRWETDKTKPSPQTVVLIEKLRPRKRRKQ